MFSIYFNTKPWRNGIGSYEETVVKEKMKVWEVQSIMDRMKRKNINNKSTLKIRESGEVVEKDEV